MLVPQQEQEHGDALGGSGEPGAGRLARILTWNINGLRKVAASHGGLKQLLDQFNSDVVCFQEIKITRAGLVEHSLARAEGYHGFFNHCKLPRKVSYSGVATFVRSESGLKTLASTTSLGDASFFGSPGRLSGDLELSPERLAALDSEGRVLVTDHGHLVLFNVYAPCISSSDENEKTDDRRAFKRDFLAALEARILEMRDRGRGIVLVGDLNACASQLDHGFTMTDADFYSSNWSKWIRGMLSMGSTDAPRLVDCFRRLHPARESAFTCWNTQTGARENNYGTRIDYIIAEASLAERALRDCDIMPEFLGSDHCPVRATRDDEGERGLGPAGMPERKWPEHPPGCSCFYRELTAKQETLARYFMSGGQSKEPPVGIGARRKGGSRQSKLTFGTAAVKVRGDGGGATLGAGPDPTGAKRIAGDAAGASLRSEQGQGGDGDVGSGDSGGGGSATRVGAIDSCSNPSRRSCDDGTPSGGGVENKSGNTDNSGGGTGGGEGVGSAEAWKTIFGQKKSAPPCEHGEPSIQRTVLKPGPNYNRRFYTCARSAGNWPTDRNARCNFFQWRRDGVRGYKDRPPRDESSGSKKRRV
ncbi:unnamed protein product [Scytosiphon promiscuus]